MDVNDAWAALRSWNQVFESLLERINDTDGALSPAGVLTAYAHLGHVVRAYLREVELAQGTYVDDWSNLTDEQSMRLASYVESGQATDALLKAAIFFSDIVHTRLLQTVFGEDRERNLKWLTGQADLRDWTIRLPAESLARAYALRIYRNQLVAHFDAPRSPASTGPSGNLLDRRLVPINFGAATSTNIEVLTEMRGRYLALPRVGGLAEVEPGRWNYFEMLNALFWSVPPMGPQGRVGDRKIIDDLALYEGYGRHRSWNS